MSGHRILIIDRDESTIKFLGYKFQEAGFAVFAERNAKEGLIAAFQHRPHIIVIEPMSVDLSLDKFIGKIKNDRRTNKSVLIIFTSTDSQEGKEIITGLGFDHYIEKGGNAFPALIKKSSS